MAGTRTVSLGVILAIGLLALTTRAKADVPPFAVGLQEVGIKNINLLNMWCDRVVDETTGVRHDTRAICMFSNTMVRKPPPEDTAKRVAELAGESGNAGVADELKRCSETTKTINPAKVRTLDADIQRFFALYTEACATKDPAKMLGALSFMVSEVEANTCKVHGSAPKRIEFKKTSDNSWEAIDAGPGMGGSVIMTIWRENQKELWNYREARAGEVNCQKADKTLCRPAEIVEFRWDREKPTLGCKRVEAGM